MKLPKKPPNFEKLVKTLEMNGDLSKLIEMQIGPTVQDKYFHWDKIRYRKAPEGLNSESWWCGIKLARRSLYQHLPFLDCHGNPHQFSMPSSIQKTLSELNEILNSTPFSLLDDDSYVHAQIEEAITSSQLEGASTTRRIAKEMLLKGRKPKDISERMIANNYQAMLFIREVKDEELTVKMIFELHKILTENTLDDSKMTGTFRKESDDIHVWDPIEEQVVHTPPKAAELPKRLELLCDFANDKLENYSIDPLIKAIVLHYCLAYDHPFIDGNGRTARALFYWSLLHAKYPLIQYISISEILRKGPIQYGRAFLYTETDDNDVTYFIEHQLEIISKAIQALKNHLKHKIKETEEIDQLMENSQNNFPMNHRQKALLVHALKHPKTHYLIEIHRKCNDVTYDTARNDLLSLEKLGFLVKQKQGKAFSFVVAPNLKVLLGGKPN